MYDIIVVGGGPAGLTAALYAARAGKTVAVAERENTGGQIVYSPLVENYPAVPALSGADFAQKLTEQVEALGVEILYDEVTGLSRDSEGFAVQCTSGEQRCKAVVLATGAAHRHLGLDGEEELVGYGVSYCAVCDGAFYTGRDVTVVGGGDTALQDALFLANSCRHVTLIHRRDQFRGEDRLVRQVEKRENITIDRSGFNASRFITHMEYLLARIRNNETLENNNDKLFNNLKQEYRETYLCAEDVRTYLQQKTGKNLGSEEMSYLMLHIERFCSREQA